MRFPLEAIIWIAGIMAIVVMEPEGAHLFSFCPISWFSLGFCPGCGLGHAVAYLFRGEFQASWEAHPLGLPAIVVLMWRIVSLLKNHFEFQSFNQNHNHNQNG